MNWFGFVPALEGMLLGSGWSVVHATGAGPDRDPDARVPPGVATELDGRPAPRGDGFGPALGDVLAGWVDEVLRHVAERHPGPLRLVDALAAAGPGGGAVVVVVERQAAAEPTVDDVARRFGLTRRQASVAMLLARRHSNAEIAKALAVSPHTARHHTERVLEKLGVTSRNRVAEVVLAAP